MGFRRGALTLAVAAGGFLPTALAFADDASDASVFGPLVQNFYGFTHDASQPTTVTWVSGELPFFQSIHQSESYDSAAADTLPAGSFQVNNEVITSAFGPAGLELLVTNSEQGTAAPPVGSVYDVIHIGGGFANFYSDIAPLTPSGADRLSDTLVTPFGDIPIVTRLHAFLNPANPFYLFDSTDPVTHPANTSGVASTDDTTAAAGFFGPFFKQFFGFEQDVSRPTTVYGIAAIPPFYQSVHQTEIIDTAATTTLPAGSFQADNNVLVYPTHPGFSELLVTRTEDDTSAPPVGSVYEINNIGHGFANVYADVAPTTPGGPDTLSDTLVTPFGDVPMTAKLHAFFDSGYSFFGYYPADPSSGTTDPPAAQPFAFFGFAHDPSQPTTVISVSGEPPAFNSVHQTEFFDSAATGTLPAGTFQANSNVVTHPAGLTNYELLVIGSTVDTSAPPVGSVFDVNYIGSSSALVNFYSDIAPTTPGGSDTISDTLVTPFGSIPLMVDFHSFADPTNSFFPY